jgi:hypothetical protein
MSDNKYGTSYSINSDGSVTSTTNHPDGSTTSTTTNPDGTMTTSQSSLSSDSKAQLESQEKNLGRIEELLEGISEQMSVTSEEENKIQGFQEDIDSKRNETIAGLIDEIGVFKSLEFVGLSPVVFSEGGEECSYSYEYGGKAYSLDISLFISEHHLREKLTVVWNILLFLIGIVLDFFIFREIVKMIK